jgi:anti-sigma B factor antagonist
VALSVDVQRRLAGEVVLVLCGELQQNTAAQLRQAVAEALATGPGRLTVDVHLMTFMESSGLGALVGARHACDGVGCDFCVVGVGPALRRTLRTTGLIDYLNAAETS